MSFSRKIKQSQSLLIQSPNSLREEKSTTTPEGNIEVCVRMRPLLESLEDEVVWEIDEVNNTIRSKVDEFDIKSLNLSHPKFYSDFAYAQKFVYDNIEGMESKNKDIYNKLFKKIVNSVVSGFNGTIFMYGQTTSGKTFTMLGTQKDPGVLPHSLRTVFQEIQAKSNEYAFTVSVSYLEIYNESINDLLVPEANNLKIMDDPMYGVVVKGLKRQEVNTFEDAIYLMSYGEEHRKYRETNVNERSSRSHTIYQVFIESFQETEEEGKVRRFSCLNLVDLAGSERLSDNGGFGDLQTGETGYINKSLFLLTNVIKKLSDGKTSHIPYRDSKLTRILSNAVGGNSLTAVFCTISPALVNYAQTLSTLRFASRAKKVKNVATENLVEDGMALKLKQEIKDLSEKLGQSQNQVVKVKKLNAKLEENLNASMQEIKHLQKEMEDLRVIFIRESSRQQGEDNISNSSLLDIIGDASGLQKSKSSKKTPPGVSPQSLSQSSELFFGDQVLSTIEQIITDNQEHLGSIEQDFVESPKAKEWSAHCLRAKHEYLRDLRALQQTYAGKIDNISQKYVFKAQLPEVDNTLKSYMTQEFQKLEAVQTRITDAVKKINPELMLETDVKEDISVEIVEKLKTSTFSEQQTEKMKISAFSEQPIDKMKISVFSEQPNQRESPDERENRIKQHYDDVLYRVEKKYDDIYNLLSQSLIRGGRDSPAIYPEQQDLERKSSNNLTSLSASPIPDRSRLLQGEDDQAVDRSNNNSVIRLNEPRLNRGRSEERQSVAGRKIFRFDSMFSKLKNDKDTRKSVNSSLQDLSSGNVYLWGSGKDGRLGSGRYVNESNPVAIKDIKFAKVVCGYHNTFGVSFEGLVYGWGRNENGQLGVGSSINAPYPINVLALNTITISDIACGWQHCVALTNDGRLFSWGCGDEGQLGHGDNFEVLTPTEIKFFETAQVQKIACGHSQSAAITTEGALYTWGHNSDCRLMIAETTSQYIPTLTEFHMVKAEAENPDDFEILAMSMGATHMCILTKNGKLFTAGRGHEGQLGRKLTKDSSNVVALKFGKEEDDDDDEDRDKDREEILCCYLNEVEEFNEENPAQSVACGEKFTLVLNDKGVVYSFGDSSDGCLGIESDEKNIYQPKVIEKLADIKIKTISAGPRHVACISEEGELYCWGFNYYDQLEVGEIEKNYNIPKKIDKLSKLNTVAVSCGYFHTAAVVV